MTSKPWFNGELSKEFFRRQRQENIIPLIALTASNPDHNEALKKSCHWYTAMMLREHLPKGNIMDTDEIVLLGIGKMVCHSIITRGNDEILSDDTSVNGVCSINIAEDLYYSQWYEQTNPGMAQNLSILSRISVGEFKTNYLDRIITAPSPQAPDPL